MKKQNKIIWITVAILIVISISATFIIKADMGGKASYNIYKLGPKTIIKSILTTGTTNPVNTVNIGSQVSGEISKIYVWYNTVVKKGQIIAKIDPTPFIEKVNMDKANLASAEANVNKQIAQTAFDKLTFVRNEKLWKENLISHAAEQQAHTTYLEDMAQERYLKSIVLSDKALLNIDSTNLSYTNIYSPVNGVVINVNCAVGQDVAASFQTPTLFTIGENISKMAIYTTTNEADLAGIKKGAKVSFTVYAYPNKTFYGTVHNVRINPTVVSGVVSYNVTIFFNNKDHLILPGMTATPKILISSETVPMAVSNAALRFMPQNINPVLKDKLTKELKPGEGVIWLLENGKPSPVVVKLGINNDSYTQVISNKLRPGDSVIAGINNYAKGTSGGFKGRFFM